MDTRKTAQSSETVTRRRLLQTVGAGGVALALGARSGVAREDGGPAQAKLRTRLTESFGLTHPFVGAGMGFVALPELVAAVSEAGGLGVLGVAPEPPPVFAERLAQIRALTRRPFGVDFFLATSPTLGPITVDGHIEIAVAARVNLAVFHFGIPIAAWVTSLKAAGIPFWVQVPSPEQALAAIAAGADGLVVQGQEAGGHNRSTTPLHHLLRDVRDEVGDGVLVLAAGGIATGADVVTALAHGADGVWVGTRLVASREAYAHPEWKRRLTQARRKDTVTTTLFGPEVPCLPYRVLRNPAVDASIGRQDEICGLPPTGAPIGTTLLFPGTSFATPGVPMPTFSALPPTPDTTGNFDAMGMPAGEGVQHIRDIKPAARIVADMMEEARSIIVRKLA
ncbi:MAG TPA: nitronate monooxygenase [Thermoanaerobaculia bacterium]|jgi:enoyl-[acyl-carrier protein] reductase II|nr:nitronate monooxygenase [Thermoanaerobaculia bacterium]